MTYDAPEGYEDINGNPARGESVYMSMGFYIDNTAADDISSVTGDFAPFSNPNQLTDAVYSATGSLALFEGDGIPTSESAGVTVAPLIPATSTEAGIWSEGISDGDGYIDWTFTISLPAVHSSALTLYTSGPNILAGTVTFSANGTDVTASLEPDTGSASVSDLETFDTITVHITQIDQPYCHVRVAEVEFGDSVTISVEELANQVTFIDEIDPLWRTLPLQELDFDLINVGGEYDEDNPDSIFGRLAIGNPINLSLTLGVGDTRMTVPMGRFVISEKGSRNNCISVVAYDVRWRIGQAYNPWSLSTSVDLGTAISGILTELEVDHEVDPAVGQIMPVAAYTFTDETSVLSDLHKVAQAYGLSILPDRNGVVQVRVGFPSDDYGTLPIQNQLSWPESSQMSKYNYLDISYGNGQHLTVDYRASPNIARSTLTVYNDLIVTLQQAGDVAARIASALYSKSVRVRWISDPILDLHDTIRVYSQYVAETEGTPVQFRAVKREITYDGILKEETTLVLRVPLNLYPHRHPSYMSDARFCWRCGCALGSENVCPQCGMPLGADGSPSAPGAMARPQRNIGGSLVLLGLVIVVVLVAAWHMGWIPTDGGDTIEPGGDSTDKEANFLWNYEWTTEAHGDGQSKVTMEVGIKNLTIGGMQTSDTEIRLETADGRDIVAISHKCDASGSIAKGQTVHYKAVFLVDDPDLKGLKVNTWSYAGEERVHRMDKSVSVRRPPF